MSTHAHSTVTPLLEFSGEIYQIHHCAQSTQRYALEQVNRNTLNKIVKPEQGDLITEAVLAPIDMATKIGVWVQDSFLGVIVDSQLLLGSQLSRIFASWHLIGCQLELSPSKGTLASVLLPELDLALISNECPRVDTHLLPVGKRWRVEPTVNAIFEDLLPQSTVLFELKYDLENLTVSYNGIECGVLNFEDASKLQSAIRFSNKNGLSAAALGRVSDFQGTTSIEIDALPMELWSKKQFRVELFKVPQLVPHQSDPHRYFAAIVPFSEALFRPKETSKNALTLSDKAIHFSPHIVLPISLLSLYAVVALRNMNSHVWELLATISLVLLALAVFVLCTRKRSSCAQNWNLVTSVGLLTSLPLIALLASGTFITEGDAKGLSKSEPQQTTLANSPPTTLQTVNPREVPLNSLLPLSSTSRTLRDQPTPTTVQKAPSLTGLLNNSEILGNLPDSIVNMPGTPASRHGIDNSDTDNTVSTPNPTTRQTTKPIIAVPPTFILLPDDPVLTAPTEPIESSEPTETTEPTEPVETEDPAETPVETTPIEPLLDPDLTTETEAEPTEASVETTEASLEIIVSE